VDCEACNKRKKEREIYLENLKKQRDATIIEKPILNVEVINVTEEVEEEEMSKYKIYK
jgi:hypothetical protein